MKLKERLKDRQKQLKLDLTENPYRATLRQVKKTSQESRQYLNKQTSSSSNITILRSVIISLRRPAW